MDAPVLRSGRYAKMLPGCRVATAPTASNYGEDVPVSRGVSTKLLAALPEAYSSEWLERMDRRTKIWRAITDRIGALESDSGGLDGLSHAKRSLIRRAVFLEMLAETQEIKFASGEAVDVGAYTQAFNSMLGAYRLLGLERKAKNAKDLGGVMGWSKGAAA